MENKVKLNKTSSEATGPQYCIRKTGYTDLSVEHLCLARLKYTSSFFFFIRHKFVQFRLRHLLRFIYNKTGLWFPLHFDKILRSMAGFISYPARACV